MPARTQTIAQVEAQAKVLSEAETEAKLAIAKQYYLDGHAVSMAAAAKHHGVSEWLLRAWLKGREPLTSRPVNGKKLDNGLEEGLLLYIKKMDDIGFPLQPEAISANADRILARNHLDSKEVPEPVGEKWSQRFLKRYPDFDIQYQETLDIGRFEALRPVIFSEYFKKLQAAWKKYTIRPEDCYTMDETSFRIGIGGRQKVVTRTARRRAFAPSSTNRDYVTVVQCVSAGKKTLPPFVILPGKNIMEAWVINTDMLDDYSLAVSDSGYSNDALCFHWLKHFDTHSARSQVGEYCMLIMDGCGSHCTLDFNDYCEQHKIVSFCLPLHSTQLLQPLDVVLFRSYKEAHRDVLNKAMRSCCRIFNKIEFLHALKKMREEAFRDTSIASAFCQTGIFSLDAEVVLSRFPGNRARGKGRRSRRRMPAFNAYVSTSIKAICGHATRQGNTY